MHAQKRATQTKKQTPCRRHTDHAIVGLATPTSGIGDTDLEDVVVGRIMINVAVITRVPSTDQRSADTTQRRA